MNVDLPDPEGPITAVNRPCWMSTVTPPSAVTCVSPEPYTFVRVSGACCGGRGQWPPSGPGMVVLTSDPFRCALVRPERSVAATLVSDGRASWPAGRECISS